MATIRKALRRSAVLTPSNLPCLSTMPTVNLTAGCLHGCLYCYARSYNHYPGQDQIVLYENTLEKIKDELSRRRVTPRAVYFSPSSDLFQPASEVLELSEAIIRFLLSKRIGVAFVTKGAIPDGVLELFERHAELVRAQIGLISVDEEVARVFEPKAATPERRLYQMESLVRAGVPTVARVDPILPSITDSPEAAHALFRAVASAWRAAGGHRRAIPAPGDCGVVAPESGRKSMAASASGRVSDG